MARFSEQMRAEADRAVEALLCQLTPIQRVEACRILARAYLGALRDQVGAEAAAEFSYTLADELVEAAVG